MRMKITLVYLTHLGRESFWKSEASAGQKNSNQNKTLTNPSPFWPTGQTRNAVSEQSQSITLGEHLLNLSWADVDFDSLLINWCLFFWPH